MKNKNNKITLNKRKWISIGLKNSWMRRLGKTLDIDGEKYQEGDEMDLNETNYLIFQIDEQDTDYLVHLMDNDGNEKTKIIPKQDPQSSEQETQSPEEYNLKAVYLPKYNVTVTEGDILHNTKGKYLLEKIHNDEEYMDVRYIDGDHKNTLQALRIDDQVKHMQNEIIREERSLKMSNINLEGRDKAFTVGYLASKGKIVVMLNEDNVAEFEVIYKQMTEDDLSRHKGDKHKNEKGNFYTRESGGNYFRVVFPKPDGELLTHMTMEEDGVVPIMHPNQINGQMSFNSKNFVMNLFRYGFHIGDNSHRINEIRKYFSDKDKISFDNGVDVRPGELLELVAKTQLPYFLNNYIGNMKLS